MTWSTTIISVERYDFTTALPFDEALARLHAGLGRPDFPRLAARLAAITDWSEFRQAVAAEAGSSGLMVFLELDLGGVVSKDPDASDFRAVRIIAGNPVTMESMVRSTPQAGAAAPTTILVFERSDGVHLRYDTAVSIAGPELTPQAAEHAAALDEAVLTLLRSSI